MIVNRASRLVSSATVMPAASPPMIIEVTDSPAIYKADHDPGHDGVGHCLAGKRQAPQHQKSPDWRDGKAEYAGRGNGAEHEFIFKPLKHRRHRTGCLHHG